MYLNCKKQLLTQSTCTEGVAGETYGRPVFLGCNDAVFYAYYSNYLVYKSRMKYFHVEGLAELYILTCGTTTESGSRCAQILKWKYKKPKYYQNAKYSQYIEIQQNC